METVHNMFQELLLGLMAQAAPMAARATLKQLIIVNVYKTSAELAKVEPGTVQTALNLVDIEEMIKKCTPNEAVANDMRKHIHDTQAEGQVPVLMMARDGYSKLFGLMLLKEGERN